MMEQLTSWPTVEQLPDGIWVYHTTQGAHLVGAWGEVVTHRPGRGGVWQACFVTVEDSVEFLAETFEPGEGFTRLPEWEQIEKMHAAWEAAQKVKS